jgi:hypothetical protein
MIDRFFIPRPVFNAEGAAGAGGAGGPGAGGDGGAGGAGGQGAGAGDGGGWKAPDGLPEHVIGKDAGETLSKLVPVYAGLRQELSTRGAVPKEANAYEIKFSDKATPVLNIQQDDKVMPILKQAMHKHGITDKQSGFVADLVDGLIDSGLMPKAQDPNELWKAMAPPEFKGSDIEKIAEGQKLMKEANTFIDNLKATAGFDDGMVGELKLLTGSPEGMRALKWIMKQGVQQSAQPGGQGSPGMPTKEEIQKRREDPRNQYGHSKYDPAFAKETEDMYRKLHPN